MVVDDSRGIGARWEQLVRTNQLYGERVVEHANGTQLQVAYAAHGMTVGDRWLALVVTLSASLPSPSHPTPSAATSATRWPRPAPTHAHSSSLSCSPKG
jgi:hypothetical protein